MTQTTHPHTHTHTHTQLSVCFQYILYLQLPPNLCEPPAPYLLPSIRLFGLKTRDETKVLESSKHRLQWSSVSTRLDPEGPLRVHWGSTDVTTSLTFSPTSVEQTQLQCLVFNSLPQLGVKHESVCLSVLTWWRGRTKLQSNDAVITRWQPKSQRNCSGTIPDQHNHTYKSREDCG